MDNRKNYLNGILMLIMILTMLTAFAVPAFAEDALTDLPTPVTADQDGNEEGEMSAAEEKPEKAGPLAEDVSAEVEEIYQRIKEIKTELNKMYESYSDEIEALMERTEKLIGKAERDEGDSCEWDPWDKSAEDQEQARGKRPGRDEFCDKFGPGRGRNENDIYDESEDLNKSDSDRDNAPSWDELMRLLEEMNGKAAQINDENEPAEKSEKKPYVGLMVSPLSDEVKAITGVQKGVLVHQVKRNTPAAKAGIQAYDIIVKVNETDITSCDELASIVAESTPGGVLRIHLYRQGSMLQLDVSPIN